jgi:hypothetical protein
MNSMTACAARPNDPTMSDILLHETQFGDGSTFPIAGWSLHQRMQRTGRAVIEIVDDTGELVELITSASVQMLTVDGSWRGWRRYPADGTRRWWALAIGHASSNDEDLLVTFTRRIGPHGNPRRTAVRPSRLNGLWIAAVPGLYTSVTCRQGPEHRIRRLSLAAASFPTSKK